MSKRNAPISSTRLSSHEASHTAQDPRIETQPERDDSDEIPVQDLRITAQRKSAHCYGSTSISNNASAVLGDITHHNYFYGGKVPYLAGLQGEPIVHHSCLYAQP